jgi:hypothetical protein
MMRIMVRRSALIIALTVASFFSSTASADESVWAPPIITTVQKNAPAPFTGVLLTPEAVAKVIAEAKDCPKRVNVEVERAKGEEKARGDKALADANADAARDRAVAQAGFEQRDNVIKNLTSRLEKSEQARSNTWLWAGGGVAVGAAIVIFTVLAIGAVN